MEDGQALAKAVVAGDGAAFERLVRAYQDRLFNFALRLCGGKEDAEEIVQDSFVKAYRALTKAMPPARLAGLALTPWLYKITLNTARNHRRARRPATVPLEGTEAALQPPAARADDPEQRLLGAEARTAVAGALLALPMACRAALLLRFVEGLSYEEAATVLGQPAGTVKSHVFRGSRRLRKLLAENGVYRCEQE